MIDLWLWPLDGAPDGPLTAADHARAARFVHDRDRAHFLAARAGLRRILGPAPLREGPRGKPFLPGGPAFNLSHAAGWAALVVGPAGLELGVDIEGCRPVDPGLAELAFAPEERAELARASDPDLAFLRGWTRKEAVIKATGEGLFTDLASFAVTLDESPRLTRFDGDRPGDWALADISTGTLTGAVACRTGGQPLRITRR